MCDRHQHPVQRLGASVEGALAAEEESAPLLEGELERAVGEEGAERLRVYLCYELPGHAHRDPDEHVGVPLSHELADGRDGVELDRVSARARRRLCSIQPDLVCPEPRLDEESLLHALHLGHAVHGRQPRLRSRRVLWLRIFGKVGGEAQAAVGEDSAGLDEAHVGDVVGVDARCRCWQWELPSLSVAPDYSLPKHLLLPLHKPGLVEETLELTPGLNLPQRQVQAFHYHYLNIRREGDSAL
mmetsp:Transcript_3314/g.7797  ORF Transcript_3314/g.7797 Transcript_3314/m.7797 type:complete len:242 (+) Transcript_3314:288-1013(+)